MQLLSKRLPLDHNIIFAGDLHCGSIATSWSAWRKMLGRVASEPNTYLCLMGDLIEAICIDDHRFSVETQDLTKLTPMDQADYVISELKPLREKILVSLCGNHELKLMRIMNFAEYMAKAIGVPYGGYSSVLTITGSSKQLYKAFLTHGYRSITSTADDPIRRKANMILSLKRQLKDKMGNTVVNVMGHSHRTLTGEPERKLFLEAKANRISASYTTAKQLEPRIDPDLRWYLNSGCFLKTSVTGTEITYSERAGYDPVDMGYQEIIVRDGIVKESREHFLWAGGGNG